MANPTTGFGLIPVRRKDGSAYTGGYSIRYIDLTYSTSIFRGDAIKHLNTGYIDRYANGGSTCEGVFMGCEYYDLTLKQYVHSTYYPASVNADNDIKCHIIDDPDVVFWIRAAGTTALLDIGVNCDITTSGTGSTLTGLSVEVAGTPATTGTFPLRIIGVADATGEGTAQFGANGIYEVVLNTHGRSTTTGV